MTNPTPWWRDAVIYQIYPRSWADGNGDGVGDLPGITARLPYLAELGVDAVWLSPFYVSPQADAGYDVADYRDIDPVFGSLSDADALIARAHQLGLRVIVDLVPNHTSDEHAWFQAALAAEPGSPERDRYIFRDGDGADGALPPNDWSSVFGGGAWTRIREADGRPGQWYLHLFDVKQPDLNWENPQVRSEFEDILRFWLDRGVDGFRVDVAHGLVKAKGLPDWSGPMNMLDLPDPTQRPPMWDQDGVHEIYREWRAVLDGYNPRDAEGYDSSRDRAMCAEAWVDPPERLARYVRPDEFHQAFNFDYLNAPWQADSLRATIAASLAADDAVGAPTTWVLSNHDVVRHASRLGLPVGTARPNGIGVDDTQPDHELGARRARAATTIMLALPGGAYIYQGEELGLPEHTALPDEVRQDPTFARTAGAELGRDGCRIPMAWEKDSPAYGFNDTGRTWLPQPTEFADLAVDQQVGVAASSLELYRRLLTERRDRGIGGGSLTWADVEPDVLSFTIRGTTGEQTTLLANLSAASVAIPPGHEVLVDSDPDGDGTQVAPDTAVWLRRTS